MSEEFQKAADSVQSLTERPSDQELLDLYGYYKQVTVGDVNTPRPGMLDLKGKAKWDNWKSREGMSKAKAEAKYIAIVQGLKAKYPSS